MLTLSMWNYLNPGTYSPVFMTALALNLNRNPRSIGVRLYIVRGSGCWMWTPCQVMVVPCTCSVKGSTTFTVPIKDKYSFLFCMLLC